MKPLPSALIGSTGFVGGSIGRQAQFDQQYSSKNIEEIINQEFDTIVCAGAPGIKWKANQDPVADKASISRLIDCLETTKCNLFVLMSTVDVFASPLAVNEDSDPGGEQVSPYGEHRLWLEEFAKQHFPRHIVVRLPGLVGRGLRKNALFDLAHDNNLEAINSEAVFQFYPIGNVWRDTIKAVEKEIDIVHLTAVPTQIGEIARDIFGKELGPGKGGSAPIYDMRSKWAGSFGSSGEYQYDKDQVWDAIREYAVSK